MNTYFMNDQTLSGWRITTRPYAVYIQRPDPLSHSFFQLQRYYQALRQEIMVFGQQYAQKGRL